jgi:glycosyltransferase involved in cell wall biosynthesis
MAATDKPLRILVVVNLPWDARLGATRVWMELAELWRAEGHVVEKYSLSDAFRDARAARVKFAIRQMLFRHRAAAFVRRNAGRFDVIDALIGTLPFSKQELNFNGLLVARSVGLYVLYDKFEQSVRQRWPQTPRGKMLGRLLYRGTTRRLYAASQRAVREADLINVPNEEEASCLRATIRGRASIIVQPYGLTAARRRAFADAAAPPDLRRQNKRICFIGMWGARKGAYDWARIIERVRAEVPDAAFRFLGTMIDDDAVRADLGAANSNGVELVSNYEPDDLPRLLSDCTVGAFPSYVEGFGLAVIEQLAAGIPVVAYNTAGPRDILAPTLPELLVPNGDPEAMAAAICRLLRQTRDDYVDVSLRCSAVEFLWPRVAAETLAAYRARIQQIGRPVLFVQPFSIGSAGGGARILRALLEHAPRGWRSICSSPQPPKPWYNEMHLRSRPAWGRLEYSRFSGLPRRTAPLFVARFRHRLRAYARHLGASAIHAVPHSGLDFTHAHVVAKELSIPFFLSVHDDLAYTAAGVVPEARREAAMRDAWRDADGCFAISRSLGDEYCHRYGARDYQVVTDGLTALHAPRLPADSNTLRIYFMGMFHMPYEANLRALLDALQLMKRERFWSDVRVTLRCEHVRPQVIAGDIPVQVLPFADEAQVDRDMDEADLLYMPLPFGAAHESFARYSLSTKMVTYVGSGLPIVYHGPASSAAFMLLQKHDAAILLPSLDPEEIARVLTTVNPDTRARVTRNALELARKQFMLADQTSRFWCTIEAKLPER